MKALSSPLILTATRRLASVLMETQLSSRVAETPGCLAYSDWLQKLWGELQILIPDGLPFILSPMQEALLWEQVLREDSVAGDLIRLKDTAALAMRALRLCRQWKLHPQDSSFSISLETRSFQRWTEAFELLLAKKEALEPACLVEQLLLYLPKYPELLPTEILWTGFDDVPPQMQHFMNGLEALGVKTLPWAPPQEKAKITQLAFPSEESELLACAQWAKKQLDNKPGEKIAVVIPELTEKQEKIKEIFLSVFDPYVALKLGEKPQWPFRISGGQPLHQIPLLSAGFSLLAAGQKRKNSLSDWIFLLRTPFIAGAQTEYLARGQQVAILKKLGRPHYSLKEVLDIAKREGDCPIWEHCLDILLAQHRSAFSEKKTFANWGRHFFEHLIALGWPGERVPNSEEFQALEQWNGVLEAYGQLDLVSPPLDSRRALQKLLVATSTTLFQMQSRAANLHILGLLEVGGQTFDQIWVTGLHNETWPSPAKPSPFIPLSLQREQHMPHATPEREWHFADQWMENLQAHCHTLRYSYPQKEADKTLMPSALLAGFPLEKLTYHLPPPLMPQASREVIPPGLVPAEEGLNAAGVAVLTHQAACPFRAFAKVRLKAETAPMPQADLSPAQRGSLLHDLLAGLWEWLGNQDTLLGTSDDTIVRFLEKQCEEQRAGDRGYQGLSARYWGEESKRLIRLIMRWLLLEKARRPFEVLACEKKVDVRLGEANFTIRIDRLDRTEQGILLLDYKSGRVHPREWMGDRPDAPQLPLYAVTQSGIGGVAYAQINPQAVRFVGLSDNEMYIPQVEAMGESWLSQQEEWTEVLEGLVREFLLGMVSVAPKKQTSCTYCDLQALCRIEELTNA